MSARIAIYTRVSSAQQARGESLAEQRAVLLELAEREGFEPVVFEDAGISAAESIDARPELIRLLEEVERGGFTRVLCYDMSRLSRDDRAAAEIRHRLEVAGVLIQTLSGIFDPSEPESALSSEVLAAVAKFQSRMQAKKARAGRRRTAEAGRWPGGPPPFGYRLAPAPSGRGSVLAIADKQWERIGRTEAEIARGIFALAAAGNGPTSIAARLDEQLVPPPSQWPGRARTGISPASAWDPSVIARIIRDRTYAGSAAWAKTAVVKADPKVQQERRWTRTSWQGGVKRPRSEQDWIAFAVPPLVSVTQWQAAQAVLGPSARNKGRRWTYMLSQRITCAVCGSTYIGQAQGEKRFRIYLCSRAHHRHADRCPNRRLRADSIEDGVWRIVERLLTDGAWLRHVLETAVKAPREGHAGELATAKRTLAAKRDEGDKLTLQFAKGIIDDARLTRALAAIQLEERGLEEKVRALETAGARAQDAARARRSIDTIAARMSARLDKMTPEERAEVVGLLRAELTCYPLTEEQRETLDRIARELQAAKTFKAREAARARKSQAELHGVKLKLSVPVSGPISVGRNVPSAGYEPHGRTAIDLEFWLEA